MRIALEDGFSIQKGTGIGQHTLNLYHQLQSYPEIESVELITKPIISLIQPSIIRRICYIGWINSVLQLHLRQKKVDIIHFTNNLIPACRHSKAKYVVTIHDMTPWRFPETLPNRYRSYITRAIKNALQKSDLVLTVSEAIKNEILSECQINQAKIVTAYNGIAHKFWEQPKKNYEASNQLRNQLGIKKDFILSVGVIEDRKNILTLLNAFEKARMHMDLQLVLVGRPGYGSAKVLKRLSSDALKNEVILPGYLSLDELITIYDNASLFVYPSLYEGFGIPLLEAMVREIPIVASRIPSTLEIARDAANYFDNPLDDNSLADRIIETLGNKKLLETMVQKGKERVKDFTWDKVGLMYLNAYKNIFQRSY